MGAIEKEFEEAIESFQRLSDVWGIARQGLVVSFNGAKVGTWRWTKNRLFVDPQGDEFRKVFREIQKNGILVRTPGIPSKEPDAERTSGASVLVQLPLGKATPGHLDNALKAEGFYLIDLQLPLLDEGE